MKHFSVEFSISAPSDEGMPLREWAYLTCESKAAINRALRDLLIIKDMIRLGEYVTIHTIIEED